MIRCVVGLGNPGVRYADTRHNAGFRVADTLVAAAGARWAWRWLRPYWHAVIEPQRTALCCKPAVFMNRSGRAVAALCRRYALRPAEILVVCDDVHLPLGRLRARQSGSAGGHNGLSSVIEALQSDAFPRLRLGVGEGTAGRVSHVLGAFTTAERATADDMIAEAARVAMQALAKEWDAVLQAATRWRPAAPHGTNELV